MSGKRAADVLRGIKRDVTRLKQRSTEGIPNLLRYVSDKATADDTVSRTVETGTALIWDDSTTSWDSERWQK